ncbi:hypothetical protein V6N12_059418 [Hibiscus sabdariffa]|uniref:RNase H type-1 domain-containing protein n=1 Tax=Hibiscus sabdariffa TaxID=183260 RepID=A0ABR2EV16_9ROSI
MKQVRQRACEICFKHIHREANSITNRLAKMVINDPAGGGIFHSPPLQVWSLMQQEHLTLQSPPLVAIIAGES